jgi:N-methylhydantoinase B
VDAPIVFRQYCCPSCWTALYSAVVPAGHIDTVTSLGRLTATPGSERR